MRYEAYELAYLTTHSLRSISFLENLSKRWSSIGERSERFETAYKELRALLPKRGEESAEVRELCEALDVFGKGFSQIPQWWEEVKKGDMDHVVLWQKTHKLNFRSLWRNDRELIMERSKQCDRPASFCLGWRYSGHFYSATGIKH